MRALFLFPAFLLFICGKLLAQQQILRTYGAPSSSFKFAGFGPAPGNNFYAVGSGTFAHQQEELIHYLLDEDGVVLDSVVENKPGWQSATRTAAYQDGGYLLAYQDRVPTSFSRTDAVLARYSSLGVLLWEVRYTVGTGIIDELHTFDNGDIFLYVILSSNNRRLIRLNAQGNELWNISNNYGDIQYATTLPGGNVLILAKNSSGQQVINMLASNGMLLWAVNINDSLTNFVGATWLTTGKLQVSALSSNGNLYWVTLDENGENKTEALVPGIPSQASFLGAETLYTNDSTLYIFSKSTLFSGGYVARVQRSSNGQFSTNGQAIEGISISPPQRLGNEIYTVTENFKIVRMDEDLSYAEILNTLGTAVFRNSETLRGIKFNASSNTYQGFMHRSDVTLPDIDVTEFTVIGDSISAWTIPAKGNSATFPIFLSNGNIAYPYAWLYASGLDTIGLALYTPQGDVISDIIVPLTVNQNIVRFYADELNADELTIAIRTPTTFTGYAFIFNTSTGQLLRSTTVQITPNNLFWGLAKVEDNRQLVIKRTSAGNPLSSLSLMDENYQQRWSVDIFGNIAFVSAINTFDHTGNTFDYLLSAIGNTIPVGTTLGGYISTVNRETGAITNTWNMGTALSGLRAVYLEGGTPVAVFMREQSFSQNNQTHALHYVRLEANGSTHLLSRLTFEWPIVVQSIRALPGNYMALTGRLSIQEDAQALFIVYDANGGITALDFDQFEPKLLTISPNPASTYIRIAFDTDEMGQNISLDMVNTLGQVVMTRKLPQQPGKTSFELETDHLPSGQYFLVFSSDKGKVARPVIIH